jgi:hypothetical protein
MKNTWLIIGFSMALLILLIVFYIVWSNRGGNNVVSLFGKSILAPIVLAAALLLYDLYTEVPSGKSMFPAVFIFSSLEDPTSCALVDFSSFKKSSDVSRENGTASACDILSYWSGKHLCMAAPDDFSLLSKEQDAALSSKESFYLDLFQLSIWRWLSMRYSVHWNLENYMSINGFFSGVSGGITPEGEQEKSLEISHDELIRIFKDNILIKTWSKDSNVPSIAQTLTSPKLPIGTVITSTRDDYNRSIKISNSEITIEIIIKYSGNESGPLPSRGLGGKIINKNNFKLFRMESYWVQIAWSIPALKRWAPSTLRKKRWAEDLASQISTDFNWQKIREKVDE